MIANLKFAPLQNFISPANSRLEIAIISGNDFFMAGRASVGSTLCLGRVMVFPNLPGS